MSTMEVLPIIEISIWTVLLAVGCLYILKKLPLPTDPFLVAYMLVCTVMTVSAISINDATRMSKTSDAATWRNTARCLQQTAFYVYFYRVLVLIFRNVNVKHILMGCIACWAANMSTLILFFILAKSNVQQCLILIAGMNGLFSLACFVLWARANCLLWELKKKGVSAVVSTTGDGSSRVSDLRLSIDVTSSSRRVSRSHDLSHEPVLREETVGIIRIDLFIVLCTTLCLTTLASVEAFMNTESQRLIGFLRKVVIALAAFFLGWLFTGQAADKVTRCEVDRKRRRESLPDQQFTMGESQRSSERMSSLQSQRTSDLSSRPSSFTDFVTSLASDSGRISEEADAASKASIFGRGAREVRRTNSFGKGHLPGEVDRNLFTHPEVNESSSQILENANPQILSDPEEPQPTFDDGKTFDKGTTMQMLLSDQAGYRLFDEHLSKTFCDENIGFFTDVVLLRRMCQGAPEEIHDHISSSRSGSLHSIPKDMEEKLEIEAPPRRISERKPEIDRACSTPQQPTSGRHNPSHSFPALSNALSEGAIRPVKKRASLGAIVITPRQRTRSTSKSRNSRGSHSSLKVRSLSPLATIPSSTQFIGDGTPVASQSLLKSKISQHSITTEEQCQEEFENIDLSWIPAPLVEIWKYAYLIFETYILTESPSEINLGYDIRDSITKFFQEHENDLPTIKPEEFLRVLMPAFLEVCHLMAADSFPYFQRSQMWLDRVRQPAGQSTGSLNRLSSSGSNGESDAPMQLQPRQSHSSSGVPRLSTDDLLSVEQSMTYTREPTPSGLMNDLVSMRFDTNEISAVWTTLSPSRRGTVDGPPPSMQGSAGGSTANSSDSQHDEQIV